MNKVLTAKISIGKYHLNVIVLIWFLLALIACLLELNRNSINNYHIFTGVFWHTLHKTNLYSVYPLEYGDTNHYGPVFSVLIAAFALLGKWAGCILWCLANVFVLFYAIQKLPLEKTKKIVVLLIAAVEMMTSIHSVQFNTMLTGFIILSFVFVDEEKDFWATLFIAAGFLIKLYGIVGLVFFFYSKHKVKFVLSFIFWLMILFCLPMLFSSPQFIVQSYKDWYASLSEKNNLNTDAAANGYMQNISAFGFIQQVIYTNVNTLYIFLTAGLLHIFALLRFKLFSYQKYWLHYLALLLLTIVLFSTGSESPTYVIAVTGVAIWFVSLNNPTKIEIALLVFVLLFTSLSATDLFPKYIRQNFIKPYFLKALPCLLVWIVLLYKLYFTNYNNDNSKQ